MRILQWISMAVAAVCLCAPASDASLDETRFFEREIRPLLASRCQGCHGETAQMGNLRLDGGDAVFMGGSRGPAAQTANPAESLILKAVSHTDPDLKMPPAGRLAEGEIAALRKWVEMGAPWPDAAAEPMAAPSGEDGNEPVFTAEQRSYWAFRPAEKPPVPESGDGWARTPVDRFIHAELAAAGLEPAEEADRAMLIRRAYFDLTGLPPGKQEVETFVNDPDPRAYEKLIGRLLESPRYGERWARRWLDLVRYAESDGYKADHYRPNAWRYRDYVIDAFNKDKPYDRFVLEQLAGDEIAPNDPEAVVAAGFLQLGIYEYNQRDARTQWQAILNDLTDVTGDVFLGMGVSCARCHDHKFDPILQKDYYRLQAFFAPILPRVDVPLADADAWLEHEARMTVWERKTRGIRERIEAIEKPRYDKAAADILDTFPEDIKAMIAKPAAERRPLERQLVALAERQAVDKGETAVASIKGEEREQLEALRKELSAFAGLKPPALPRVRTVSDIGPVAPPTRIPGKEELGPVEPGFPSILDPSPADIEPSPAAPNSTGRRAALARWIVDPENPLTARVIVNRVWQYHFGRGLVETASEFGRLGAPPSHPELLDWLACAFVESGWRFKELHRLIMTSAAYRQTSRRPAPETARLRDPENTLLWRMNVRRLESEEIRDAILASSGELDLTAGGPGVEFETPRRSVYVKAMRNTRDMLMDAFDTPDGLFSAANRNTTTTPIQSLFMMNGDWVYERARRTAARLGGTARLSAETVANAYRAVLGRDPTAGELTEAAEFLRDRIEAVKNRYAEQRGGMIAAVNTLFDGEAGETERRAAAGFLRNRLDRLVPPGAVEEGGTVLAGGEGGPGPRLADESGNGDAFSASPPDAETIRASALTDLCHVLINSNEFLYVE